MLYVHNQGNGPLPLRFLGRDQENVLTYDIQPDHIVLDAGERITVQGQVNTKQRDFVGKSQQITYDIISQSLSPSAFIAPVSGQVEIKPLLSNWKIPLGIGTVLMLAVLVLVGLFFSQINATGDQSTNAMPQITRFVANDSETPITVEVNEPILVQWQTQDANVVYINARHTNGDTVRYTVAAQAPNGHILYLPNTGRYRLALQAANNENQTDSNEIEVVVLPQLSLRVYTVSPATTQTSAVLYRNVNGQRIVIEWRANHGQDVAVTPLQLSIGDQLYPISGPTGQLTVEPNGLQNRPEGVQVALGTATETLYTATLPVIYPECISLRNTTLYDEPAIESLVVPLTADTTFQIDGQNATGWVRVILPLTQIDFGYWGWIAPDLRTDIRCTIDYAELGQIVSE